MHPLVCLAHGLWVWGAGRPDAPLEVLEEPIPNIEPFGLAEFVRRHLSYVSGPADHHVAAVGVEALLITRRQLRPRQHVVAAAEAVVRITTGLW